MRILLVTTDYPEFQTSFYRREPQLERADYATQVAAREQSLFGLVGGYAHYLRELGHEVGVVIANCAAMQRAWAQENGVAFRELGARRWVLRKGVLPWVTTDAMPRWRHQIALEQVRAFRPDLLINQTLISIPSSVVSQMRRHAGMVVGVHGTRVPDDFDPSPYDILFTGHAGFAQEFRDLGARRVELLPHAFDARVLDAIALRRPTIPVTFVGSIGALWPDRLRWLSALCERYPVSIYGPMRFTSATSEHAAVRKAYQCERWGIDMFQVLRDSKMSLNTHAPLAGDRANNMRLFEITGVGSLMVTDAKPNQLDWFEPDREIVTYASTEECLEKVGYYLEHEEERAAVAEAGQRRTLRCHTLKQRIDQFAAIVTSH